MRPPHRHSPLHVNTPCAHVPSLSGRRMFRSWMRRTEGTTSHHITRTPQRDQTGACCRCRLAGCGKAGSCVALVWGWGGGKGQDGGERKPPCIILCYDNMLSWREVEGVPVAAVYCPTLHTSLPTKLPCAQGAHVQPRAGAGCGAAQRGHDDRASVERALTVVLAACYVRLCEGHVHTTLHLLKSVMQSMREYVGFFRIFQAGNGHAYVHMLSVFASC